MPGVVGWKVFKATRRSVAGPAAGVDLHCTLSPVSPCLPLSLPPTLPTTVAAARRPSALILKVYRHGSRNSRGFEWVGRGSQRHSFCRRAKCGDLWCPARGRTWRVVWPVPTGVLVWDRLCEFRVMCGYQLLSMLRCW